MSIAVLIGVPNDAVSWFIHE